MVTLNGKRIAAGTYLRKGSGTLLNLYEVGPLLRPGGNRLVVELRSGRGNGWASRGPERRGHGRASPGQRRELADLPEARVGAGAGLASSGGWQRAGVLLGQSPHRPLGPAAGGAARATAPAGAPRARRPGPPPGLLRALRLGTRGRGLPHARRAARERAGHRPAVHGEPSRPIRGATRSRPRS